jgi:hypothetical protein
LNDGWISAAPLNVNRTSEIWSHAQTLFAILRMPDYPDAQREFLPALEVPFAPALEISDPHRRYRWRDLDGVEHDKCTPVLWIAAAQGAALGKPGLLEGQQREAVLRHYQYVQEILKEYHPTESGGWNMLPRRTQTNTTCIQPPSRCSCCSRQRRLTSMGRAEQRDRLIRQTAQWLIDHFDPKGDPLIALAGAGLGDT